MEFHPFASVFPLLEGDELQALAADIREHGLRDPIVTFEGKILDGRNRQTACTLAKIQPRYDQFSGTRQQALQFVMSENLHRRHLTSSQRAAAAIEFERQNGALVEELRRAAEQRKQQAKGQPRGVKQHESSLTQKVGQETDRHDRSTDAQLATMFGTNRQTLADARKIAAEAPEKFEAVKKGEATIPQAKRELQPQKPQPPIADVLFSAFKTLLDRVDSIFEQFGSGDKMLASKAWRQCDTGGFLIVIEELAEKFTRLNKECQKYAEDNEA